MFNIKPKKFAGSVLKARGVYHQFGEGAARTPALADINLKISAGEIVTMIGKSGCGKTTLLTLIGGLRAVQEGSLRVLGTEMKGLSAEQAVIMRRQIGFIFQLHNLFDALTARENVLMALELNSAVSARERNVRARTELARLGLGDHLHKKPQKMSGGQRQRVAIARALVNRPRLILADEPTAALDEESGETVVNIFQELSDGGSTILIVTHDQRVINKATRVVEMEKTGQGGRIKTDFEPEESIALGETLAKAPHPELSKCDPGVLANMVQRAELRREPSGKVFFRHGEPADTLYLIREGTVELIKPDRFGGEASEIKRDNEFFGETALFSGGLHSATAIAHDDVDVYCWPRAKFLEALRKAPSFQLQLMNALLDYST